MDAGVEKATGEERLMKLEARCQSEEAELEQQKLADQDKCSQLKQEKRVKSQPRSMWKHIRGCLIRG